MTINRQRHFSWLILLLAAGLSLAPRAEALAAVRTVKSIYLTLITDAPTSREVDELPEVFDQAVAGWQAYFGVPKDKLANWHVRAVLAKDLKRMQAAGYWPDDLPEIRSGFSRDDGVYMKEQTSQYYRRHLLLHEGTHSFMYHFLRGAGRPWYTEGMAEMLATHRWQNGKLTLNIMPANAKEVLKLGRIELVRRELKAGRGLSVAQIMAYELAMGKDEPYAWSWALCTFLSRDSRYGKSFAKLAAIAGSVTFNDDAHDIFADADSSRLESEWQIFSSNLCYGYDFARMNVVLQSGQPLVGSKTAQVRADQSWQSTGVKVEKGACYHVAATGRYQVAKDDAPWISEPNGVTLAYVNGQPLGQLQAVVQPEHFSSQYNPWLKPLAIGLSGTVTPETTGVLYLRVNDSAATLDDNAGSAEAVITLAR